MLWHLLGTRDYCALVGSSLHRSREVDVVSETFGPTMCAHLCEASVGLGRDGTMHISKHGTREASGLLKMSDEICSALSLLFPGCFLTLFDTEAPCRFSTPT